MLDRERSVRLWQRRANGFQPL